MRARAAVRPLPTTATTKQPVTDLRLRALRRGLSPCATTCSDARYAGACSDAPEDDMSVVRGMSSDARYAEAVRGTRERCAVRGSLQRE